MSWPVYPQKMMGSLCLELNSAASRTQNELHIHIDCVRADVHEALAAHAGHIGATLAPFPVTPLDTTGAGDAFCGEFAAALAGGAAHDDAVRFGAAAGALATTKHGAVPSLPRRAEIDRLLTSG